MPSPFWTNTIWYILLLITSIISMVFVLIKSKYRLFTVAFTLAILGLIYVLESIIALSFNAYSYCPKITNDIFQDNVFGNIFSQVSIASTTALTIIYDLSFKWYIILAITYYFIEELFINLGIYHHFWYRSIYTVIGLIPLFWFTKMWCRKLICSPKYFVHYITLFLSSFSVISNTIIMPMKLLKIQIFKVDFYNEFSKNHTTTTIIYGFFLINILINLRRWRVNWEWKGVAFTILFFIQYVLYKSGIIFIKNGWFFIITLTDLLGIYFWIVILDFLLHKKPAI